MRGEVKFALPHIQWFVINGVHLMPVQALNTQFILGLAACVPEKGSVCFFDTEIKGFLLELRSSGGATYYFRYRDFAGQNKA